MTDRYVQQPDGYLDSTTGLIWEVESHGPMSWQEAQEYAASLGDGWRVPTRAELLTLVDDTLSNPATTLPGMTPDWHWSSSSFATSASYAWLVDFYPGDVLNDGKSNAGYVRCVRRGQVEPSGLRSLDASDPLARLEAKVDELLARYPAKEKEKS